MAVPSDDVISLAIAASNPSQVWAGTLEHGVYRTTDAGVHWTAVGPRPQDEVQALAVSGSNVYAVLPIGFRDPGGVLASSDGGTTWQPRNTGLTALGASDLAIDPHHPEVL